MVKYLIITIPVFFAHARVQAQKVFTLQQCIDIALQYNLQVNQSMYQMQSNQVDYNQSRLNLLPNINGNINHSRNQGRTIDPVTNVYETQKFSSGNIGISGDVVLFQGFSLRSLMKQSALNYEASKMDWQQQKDNITLNMILAYLQLLNNEDFQAQALSQESVSNKQVARLKIMDDSGVIAPAELYDMEAQLANDRIAIVTAKQNVESAKIALCALMNIPYEQQMKFERDGLDTGLGAVLAHPQAAYKSALRQFAAIQAAELSVVSAEQGIKAMKGYLAPRLSLGSRVYSNYSSTSAMAYGRQLQHNTSSSIALSLGIPIFNSLNARNNIKRAVINFKTLAARSQTAKTTLQQNIEQAWLNLEAALECYRLLQTQATALQNSFMAAEAKFTAGAGNSVDYITVKNRLDNANSNLIAGRYTCLLREKIYSFYQGILKF